MGSSRQVAAGLLGIVRDYENLGATELLSKFHLDELAGKPAEDVLLQLGELVCPPGGSIDEGIARNALMEAIAELAESGVQSFDQLSETELKELLAAFLTYSIEGRIVNDVGMKEISLPSSTTQVIEIQQQLHDFIRNCVKDVIVTRLTSVRHLTNKQVDKTMSSIYEACFELIEALSENYETE